MFLLGIFKEFSYLKLSLYALKLLSRKIYIPLDSSYNMTKEPQNPYKNAQAIYQEVLSKTKYADGKWGGLIKFIVDKVSTIGEIHGEVTLKNSIFMPGEGYKADVEYAFGGKVMPDIVREDKNIGGDSALEEAVVTLKSYIEPLEFSRSAGDKVHTRNISISGPILEKPVGEYEVAIERHMSPEDNLFLEATKRIDIHYIHKKDIVQMRLALQARFPDNYGIGKENDLSRFTPRGVISEFKKKLSYIQQRNL